MAAPTFVGAGTGLVTTGTLIAPEGNTTVPAGSFVLVQVLADGLPASDPVISAAVTSTQLVNLEGGTSPGRMTPVTPGGALVGSVAKQYLFAGRTLAASAFMTAAFTVDGAVDHYGRMYWFAGVNDGTTLADVIENGTAGTYLNGTGATAAIADRGVVTLGADRLALNFIAVDDDNPLAAFTGMTGGTWAEAVAEFASATGTDGAIQLQTAAVYSSPINTLTTSTSTNSTGSAAADQRYAQQFTAPSTGTLLGVTVRALAQGTPADDLTVEIQTESGGNPSGTVIGTAVNVDVTGGTAANYYVPVAAPITSGVKYWIVLRRTGAIDGANYYLARVGPRSTYPSHKWQRFNGSSWTDFGTESLAFAIHLNDAGTIDGGTQTMAAADNWGVIGFALKPVPSGPTTHYGATSSAYGFIEVTAAQRRTTSSLAMPVAFAAVVAGQITVPAVTHYGALAAPFAYGAAVAGQRKAFGATANPYTFSKAVAGQRKTFGVTATPLTFSKAVAASRRTFGALAAPFTFGAVTAGVVTSGAVTHYGALTAPFTFGEVTQGRRRTTSSLVAPFTFTKDVRAQRRTTGQTATSITFGAVTASRKQYARTTAPFVFGSTINATKKTYGVVARPFTFGAVTSGIGYTGAATYFGATAWTITFGEQTQGKKKTFGVVARPTTWAAVVQGRRTTRTQIAAVYTFAALTQAKRKTHATVAMPIQWLAVTRGVSTVGIQTYYGVVAAPFTFNRAVAAQRRTFATTATPITFSAFTKGMLMAAILNYADDIRWGEVQADRVMVGTVEVWTPGEDL